MELWPHQLEALEKVHNGCVLNGGVGSGKTITSLSYYVQVVCKGSLDRSGPMEDPRTLVVITTAKKRDDLDWESDALHLGLFRDQEVSYGNAEFIVDSWNNMHKYEHLEDAFFIFDEQKVIGNGAWVKSFYKICKKNQWILLSATPADSWIDYVPLFVANGFYRNRTDFIENHVVWTFHGKYRKIRGYFGTRRLEAYRDAILVEMPYQRHTTRHLEQIPVYYDAEQFDMVWKRLWNVYDAQPLVDVAEKHRIGRKVVNSDPSRLDAIAKLSFKHPRLIIFYTF